MDILVIVVKIGCCCYLMFIMIFIIVVICYVDCVNFVVVLVYIQEEFGISKVEMGYVFFVFVWLYIFCQISGGWFFDCVGFWFIYFIVIFGWLVVMLL